MLRQAIEIIPEASRRLPDAWKTRHAAVPWRKVAGIGNVLRHDYDASTTRSCGRPPPPK
jgi:uncharacterized protein with HEPN domain